MGACLFGDSVRPIVEQLGWVAGILSLAVTILVVLWQVRQRSVDAAARTLRKADNPEGYKKRRAELRASLEAQQGGAAQRYRRELERILAFADRVYGPNRPTLRDQ